MTYPPNTHPSSKGPSNRTRNALIAVCAVLLVALAGVVIYLVLNQGGQSAAAPPSAPAENATGDPADDPSGPPDEGADEQPLEPVGAPVPVHGNPGQWLLPDYADGATEMVFEGDGDVNLVGFDPVSSVMVVHYETEERATGVLLPDGGEAWTYGSYSCSSGSWDGMVLCADGTDPASALDAGRSFDLVLLDIADGSEVERYDLGILPENIEYLGEDDARVYFAVTDHSGSELNAEQAQFGEGGILALNPDRSVSWHSSIGIGDPTSRTALVASDLIAFAIGFGDEVVLADRASGAVVDRLYFDGAQINIFWDGYSVEGAEFGELALVRTWDGEDLPVPEMLMRASPGYMVSTVSPTYEIEGLVAEENLGVLVGPSGERWYETTMMGVFEALDGSAIDIMFEISVSPDGEVLAGETSDMRTAVFSGRDGSLLGELDPAVSFAFVQDGLLAGHGSGYNLHVLVPDPAVD